MAVAYFVIAGLSVAADVEVDVPNAFSFHASTARQLSGWNDIEGAFVPQAPSPWKFRLGPRSMEEVWRSCSEAYAAEYHDLWASVPQRDYCRDVAVLQFDTETRNAYQMASWVLSALRLFAPGDLHLGVALLPSEGGLLATQTPRWEHVPAPHRYPLSRNKVMLLPIFFERLSAAMPLFSDHPEIAIARRYLARSMHRSLRMGYFESEHGELLPNVLPLEDVVLNLSISLDAALTLGTPWNRDLSATLRRRIAHLFAGEEIGPFHACELFDWLHEVRNRVAHGAFRGDDDSWPRAPALARYPREGAANVIPALVALAGRHLAAQTVLALAGLFQEGRRSSDIAGILDSSDTLVRKELRALRAWLPKSSWSSDPYFRRFQSASRT